MLISIVSVHEHIRYILFSQWMLLYGEAYLRHYLANWHLLQPVRCTDELQLDINIPSTNSTRKHTNVHMYENKTLRRSIPSVGLQQHPCVQSSRPDEEESSHDSICSCLKQCNAVTSTPMCLETYEWSIETQWRVLPLQLMSILASSFILDIKSFWIPSRFPFLASLRNCSSGSSSSMTSPTKQNKALQTKNLR